MTDTKTASLRIFTLNSEQRPETHVQHLVKLGWLESVMRFVFTWDYTVAKMAQGSAGTPINALGSKLGNEK